MRNSDEVGRILRQKKVYVVFFVLSTTVVIPNRFFDSLLLLSFNEALYFNMQKAAIFNKCCIVRKFMQMEADEIA